MKILKYVGLTLAGLAMLFVLIGLLLPSRYHVERSVVINAPTETVFAHVNTLRHWPEWTAWTVKKYPDMKLEFHGPEAGVGAEYRWTGEQTGSGILKITSSDPAKGIDYDLDFDAGQHISKGRIAMEPSSSSLKVTWTNEGELGMNPINRYFGLLMDSFMGPDFQEGLENLKKRSESETAMPSVAPAEKV